MNLKPIKKIWNLIVPAIIVNAKWQMVNIKRGRTTKRKKKRNISTPFSLIQLKKYFFYKKRVTNNFYTKGIIKKKIHLFIYNSHKQNREEKKKNCRTIQFECFDYSAFGLPSSLLDLLLVFESCWLSSSSSE